MGEVGSFIRGNALQKKDFVDSGEPCIHYGQIYTFYKTHASETKSFVPPELFAQLKKAPPKSLIMTTTSENIEDVCKSLAWLGSESVAIGGHSCVFVHDLNPMYVAFYTQTRWFQDQKNAYVKGTKVKDISISDLAKVLIPVPDLQVQDSIAEILSSFEALVEGSSTGIPAEIKARRQQYEYYRDKLLTFKELKAS